MFLFYVFWEATLIPMALLIGSTGTSADYAAVVFPLHDARVRIHAGPIIWLYLKVGSFDYAAIQNALSAGQIPGNRYRAPWLFSGSSSHSR